MLVDDELGIRLTLAANLEVAGFDVVAAESVMEAVERLSESRFDLLVSDVHMPGLDGVDGLAKLRAVQPDLPAVFVTGYDAEGLVPQVLAKGAFTVLAKPVSVTTLVSVIRKCLAHPIVLVVDDEEPFLDALVESLRLAGLSVERVSSGEAAIDFASRAYVDVCVLDLVMPGVDGAQVFAKLREKHPEIAVIAMTGHDVGPLIREVMKGGALHCLRKPFEMAALARLIGQARASANGRKPARAERSPEGGAG